MRFTAQLAARQQGAIGEWGTVHVTFHAPDLATQQQLNTAAINAATEEGYETFHVKGINATPDMRDIGDIVDDFLRENSGLQVVACEMRADLFYVLAAPAGSTLRVQKHLATIHVDTPLTYHYGTDEWSCTFTRYSEVGEPYQRWFNKRLQSIANGGDDDFPAHSLTVEESTNN